MSGQFRRNGKIWVRVLADIPIIGKPTEVRMGRGKGNPTGWIARVSRGKILFEMDGMSLSNARQAATLAAHKLCSSTKFVQWSNRTISRVDRGPDLDVERSSQAEAEKKAYDSVGVK
ncbi:60S ribosomal protein L16, mitochondrial [Capsicum baccatum]|uniref:Large ribosomal subunit protein uL16m n=1 Tax=Capsicum baccatum TaxID=33114 RepID=A0A2G2XM96_CAPBA|nr:60S ribosomal protein L16, mitochondrial [Capsicum baccatum]